MARPVKPIEVNMDNAIIEASASGVAIRTSATGPKAAEGKPVDITMTQAELAEMLPRLLRAFAASIDLSKLHEF